MARPLNADRANPRGLSASVGVFVAGAFPGASTFPGSSGGSFPGIFPGSFPDDANYLYPGRGDVISVAAASARTLTGVPA